MSGYPHNFKTDCVRRMSGPGAISATEMAKSVSVSQSCLSTWLRDARAVGLEAFFKMHPMNDKPTHFSPADKMRLVMEAKALDPDQFGAWLRREGLHKAQLVSWEKSMLTGLTSTSSPKASRRDLKRIKRLEKELNRKDKALAETAALLVLQKKVQDLWGDEDTSTTKTNAR
jgi:transposase